MTRPQTANPILETWNRYGAEAATEAILPCNGSRNWAVGVVELRPFDAPLDIFEASDKVWRSLARSDWQQAFDSHPRIGETKAEVATKRSLSWSNSEQSSARLDDASQAELTIANMEYEARFGRIFIICATGRSAGEMLLSLRQRLHNSAEAEMQEAAEQQRRITQLRLRKWLELPAAKCEEV